MMSLLIYFYSRDNKYKSKNDIIFYKMLRILVVVFILVLVLYHFKGIKVRCSNFLGGAADSCMHRCHQWIVMVLIISLSIGETCRLYIHSCH